MAIAFDAAAGGQATTTGSISWNHTCSGSNRLLVVGVQDALADDLTGITYNSVALTFIGKIQAPGGIAFTYIYYLLAPSTGINSVVVSFSGVAQLVSGVSTSYTGVNQSGQPDSSFTNNAGSPTTSFGNTFTTVADNSWAVVVAANNGSQTISAGTGITVRFNSNAGTGIFDSNSAIHPAGSYATQVTSGSSTQWGAACASFSPSTSSPITLHSRTLLGVGI